MKINICLELPKNEGILSSIFPISGWIVSDFDDITVEIYMNSSKIGTATLTDNRLDLRECFLDEYKNCNGFFYEADSKKF